MLKVNDYFDSKVKSISFGNSLAGQASIGVMSAGEYKFSTGKPEEMTVVSGSLKVLLAGETSWRCYEAGSAFPVPGHSEFHVQVAESAAYLCRYLD